MPATTRTTRLATGPQRDLISQLLGEVTLTPEAVTEITDTLKRPNMAFFEAQQIIPRLLDIKKAQRAAKRAASTATAAAAPAPVRVSPLADLPDTRFCVPVAELSPRMAEMAGNSDLLFGETKSWKDWRYMNVLHGSHPVFTREKITGVWAKEVADILRKDLLAYVRLYGTEFKCCSSCGAELTDEISRQLQLGPDCRKKFGL